MDYEKDIISANKIADIFEIAKRIVKDYLGFDQAGLMVGLTDLGSQSNGFIGAFYSLNANTIIINKRPLASIMSKNPSMHNYYLFHVMLHEYIHSIGSYDEAQTQALVKQISECYFGSDHIITQLSVNIEKFMPDLVYPSSEFQPGDINIDFVEGIDRKNTTYIN